MQKIKAVVLGASGYTGIELLRLLYRHPYVDIKYIVSNQTAGMHMKEIYSVVDILDLPILSTTEDVEWSMIDVAFMCLPHGLSHTIINKIPSGIKVIDLSADFRIKDHELYNTVYAQEHQAKDLLSSSAYGLSEIFYQEIKTARIIACPGCYPTSVILPLYPLFKEQLILSEGLVIDSKSGISGAGRSLKTGNLFSEVDSNVRAYNIGKHRHSYEMQYILSTICDSKISMHFTPQIVPMTRGILSNIYCYLNNTSLEDITMRLQAYYQDSYFVKVMNSNTNLQTKDVLASNFCKISCFFTSIDNMIMISSVIDNLTKGASGQAVQNMNIIFDLDEKTVLEQLAIFP